jgi:hypothetical protein
VGGVVVADQAPGTGRDPAEFGDRRVEGLQLERAGRRRAQQVPERSIDYSAVARHHHRAAGVGTHGSRDRGADPEMEFGDRLAAWKHVVVWIAGPVRGAEPLDEGAEGHPVDVGARVVFAEAGIDLHREIAECRSDRVSGLDRSSEVARDQDVSGEFTGGGEAVTKLLGLPATEIRQPVAAPVSTDHPIDGDVRLAVSDEGECGRRCIVGGRHERRSYEAGRRVPRSLHLYARAMGNVRLVGALMVAGALGSCTVAADETGASTPRSPAMISDRVIGSSPPDGTTSTDLAATGPDTSAPSAPFADGALTFCSRTGVDSGGVVANAQLVEASGLVASRTHQDLLWSHNDGAGRPGVFAIGADGLDLGFHPIAGVDAVDIEDIAFVRDAGRDDILLADIGDNGAVRDSITIFRFAEPDPAVVQEVTDVERLQFVYPDRPHNAEVLLVDDAAGRVVIVTKEQARALDGTPDNFGSTMPSFVFEGALDGHGAGPVELVAAGLLDMPRLEELATVGDPHPATLLGFGGVPTGGDVSVDGGLIALRTYEAVWLWAREPGQTVAEALAGEPCEVRSALEPQGEAVAFVDGGLMTLSEGVNQPLHRLGG